MNVLREYVIAKSDKGRKRDGEEGKRGGESNRGKESGKLIHVSKLTQRDDMEEVAVV